MRRIEIVALTAIAAVALAVSALASGGPRLEGKFDITATFGANDISLPPPATGTDIFKFTCKNDSCSRVKLDRNSGGRHFKSVLRRRKPGLYKGHEGPNPYTCVDPIGDPGSFESDIKVRVTKSKNGHATRISGSVKIEFTDCTETFENVTFTGKLQ